MSHEFSSQYSSVEEHAADAEQKFCHHLCCLLLLELFSRGSLNFRDTHEALAFPSQCRVWQREHVMTYLILGSMHSLGGSSTCFFPDGWIRFPFLLADQTVFRISTMSWTSPHRDQIWTMALRLQFAQEHEDVRRSEHWEGRGCCCCCCCCCCSNGNMKTSKP